MKKIFIVLITITLVACSTKEAKEAKEAKEDKDLVKQDFVQEAITVTIITAAITNFNMEILSNGKLQSKKKAEIPFEINERINSIYVKNGDRVTKGSLLAELDKTASKRKLKNAKIGLDKAKIELQDILLGFGYQLKDTLTMPQDILKNIKIQSNYSNAISNLEEASYNYSKTTIKAPFSGIIANLTATSQNFTSNYKNTLCTLINDTTMEIVFPVLESEISKIRKNQQVEVLQFSELNDTPSIGRITEINPIIDQDGMVNVKAQIKNTKASFLDGMNIKIRIKNSIPNKIVVPKSAVLLRQNKQVVFVYKDGEAQWVYVETGKENSTHIVINKGIKEGDKVIVSGNLNLAHQTKVTIEE